MITPFGMLGLGAPPPLTALFAVLALIGVLVLGREIVSRFGARRATSVAPTVRALEVEPGARVNRIPAYRARLQWHVSQSDPDTIGLLDDLLTMGLSLSASDIHLTPGVTNATSAFRIHGILYDFGQIPGELFIKLVSRIKVMAALTLYKRSTPQDGQIDLHGGRHKVRVSVLPTNHGEKVVLRIASADYQTQSVDRLGMSPEQMIRFKGLLNSNQGMLIVTGPTGSGKTTTMYASLLHIQRTRGETTNIVTLEDPIEFDFPQFSQTQIDTGAGMTFAIALRSVLRQDPDVILVGEIRDDETAAIALRAALTGHLLFATLHSDRAAGVFARLIQMGLEPHHVASAVRAVISQRLCQRLCQECRVETALTQEQIAHFEILGHSPPPEGPFFVARGCPSCLDKGFDGRVAVYELLLVTDEIRDLIHEGRSTHQIDRLARERGMRTLYEEGVERARSGLIPIDEVLRVLAT